MRSILQNCQRIGYGFTLSYIVAMSLAIIFDAEPFRSIWTFYSIFAIIFAVYVTNKVQKVVQMTIKDLDNASETSHWKSITRKCRIAMFMGCILIVILGLVLISSFSMIQSLSEVFIRDTPGARWYLNLLIPITSFVLIYQGSRIRPSMLVDQ